LVLCFAAVAIWTSDILDDEFHDETASHQLEAVLKEEQDMPMSSSSGFLRRLSLPGNAQLAKEMVAKSRQKKVQDTLVPVRVLSSGFTSLHEAAEDGDVSEVKALLANGAEVNAKTKYYGYTPLHAAALLGHVNVVKLLLSKGAEVNAKITYGWTPLQLAAKYGHVDVVKLLLSKGAEVDAKDKYGYTPLHEAANNGHVDVVKLLLSKGAEVHAKDKYGYTPLHEAANNGHVDVVKLLLSKGAEVDAKDKYGYTPLHEAAYYGQVNVVKVLLSKGAEVNAKTNSGRTPLQLADKYGYLDVVKVLLSKGAEVNAKNKDGETPLHVAALKGHLDVVQALKSQQVIKLAQRAEKWKESSEVLWMLTDTLQERCLPEVAKWAVDHSYAIDDFPGDAVLARSCVLQYMSFEARERLALRSKWSYVCPGAGVAIAAVSVYIVEPLTLHHFGSLDASHHEERNAFYHGAHLLVARATIKWYWPKLAFRFLEAIAIIAFFMGFAMVELWWALWLPFVGLLFLLPGITLYGTKELIRAPVKCIASMNVEGGYMLSFLRLLVIFGAYKSVEATTGWRRGETIGWMQMFVNPLYEGLQNKINFMWPEATLAPFLGFRSSISWVKDLIKVLAQKSAFNISELGKLFLFLSLAVYACSLLVREKQHQGCKVKGDIPDINYVSNAQKLAQSPTDKVPELIEEIKQEEPALQVRQMGTWSLIKMLMPVALDVLLDVNTIRTLILSSNLRFACALTFVVARSTFREWNNFYGLKEAVRESYKRGMLHQQLIDLLEEEKGAEAFFSLSITSYSYAFCVQTADQAVVQWVSILFAAYGIAEFLVQKMEFPTTEFPTTQKVNSFVIVPSEESQKEKGDA